jgi:hypothetical protein
VNNSTATDQPTGTWVPPQGSSVVSETPNGMPVKSAAAKTA